MKPIAEEVGPDWELIGNRATLRADRRISMEQRSQDNRPCYVKLSGGEDAPNTVHACRDWVEARRVVGIVRARS